jgi:hypothetical protein
MQMVRALTFFLPQGNGLDKQGVAEYHRVAFRSQDLNALANLPFAKSNPNLLLF